MSLLGTSLALLILVAVVAAARVVWRRPILGLPVLVAGMAVHNVILMALVDAVTSDLLIRAAQAWKELLIGVLAVRLLVQMSRLRRRSLSDLLATWRQSPVRLMDVAAAVFAVSLLVYLALPSSLFPGHDTTLAQRLVSFRMFALIPTLYVFGRAWAPATGRDRLIVVGLLVGSGAFVGMAGLVELWAIPTRAWLDLGVIRFDAWLGYHYQGPAGLPENFFQSTSFGLALRRMVSTYLSPLGVAYTGLLLAPLTFVYALGTDRRARWAWVAFGLIVLSVTFAFTRLALLCLTFEAMGLAIVFRGRVALVAAGAMVVAVLGTFLIYPNVGPLVAYDLADVRPPIVAQLLGADAPTTPSGQAGGSGPRDVSGDVIHRLITSDDASIQAHVRQVQDGVAFLVAHPFGSGLGSTVSRYGTASGPGESALLGTSGELGIVGLLAFLGLYGGAIAAGLWATLHGGGEPRRLALPIMIGIGGIALFPIVVTSQVWGDFSVTFLFWWGVGAVVSHAALVRGRPLAAPAANSLGSPMPGPRPLAKHSSIADQ